MEVEPVRRSRSNAGVSKGRVQDKREVSLVGAGYRRCMRQDAQLLWAPDGTLAVNSIEECEEAPDGQL